MYARIETQCFHCRRMLTFEKKVGRRDECPHCSAEIHVCRNCDFYDPRLARGCREPQAEEVRDLERANFCNWFQIRRGASGVEDPAGTSEKAKAGFDALFGKGPAPKDPGKDEAKAAFDALFSKKK